MAIAAFAACVVAGFVGKFALLTAALLGAGAVLASAYVLPRRRVSMVPAVLVVALTYLLGSGLAVGAVRVTDLASIDFWGGDGRIFVYYLPLLFFAVVRVDSRGLTGFVRVAISLAVATLLMFTVFLTGLVPGNNFEGLLTHHIGAGSFFGALSIFLVVYGTEANRNGVRNLGLLLFLPAAAAGSRMVLGIYPLVLLLFVVRKRRLRDAALVAGLGLGALVALPLVAPWTIERLLPLLRDPPFQAVAAALETIEWQAPEDTRTWGGEHWNVVWRFVYWRRALELFADSPILGAGFGRYDDLYVAFGGIKGLLYMGTEGQRSFGPLHAHNSLLHFLAESGLVGAGLMGYVWYRLHARARRISASPLSPAVARHYATGCVYVVYFALALSVLTHSLAAPSLGLLVVPLLGGILGLEITRSDLVPTKLVRVRVGPASGRAVQLPPPET